MGEKLVRKYRSVLFDFDEVDGHCGDFGKDDAAEGVGEGKGDGGEDEVDVLRIRLQYINTD